MYDNSLAEYISYFKVGFGKYHIMYTDLKKKCIVYIKSLYLHGVLLVLSPGDSTDYKYL
jgi:hypothetical protein